MHWLASFLSTPQHAHTEQGSIDKKAQVACAINTLCKAVMKCHSAHQKGQVTFCRVIYACLWVAWSVAYEMLVLRRLIHVGCRVWVWR